RVYLREIKSGARSQCLPTLEDWQRIIALQTLYATRSRHTIGLPFFIAYFAQEERIMASTIEVVESYRSALGRGDFGAARGLMQDDMTFQGPLDTFNTADQYLEAATRLASIIQRIDVEKTFVNGNHRCVLYDVVTKPP